MADPGTHDRLLDATWAEVGEHGVDRLTLAAVAARAGVSRQAVYLHFRNRASLLVELAARADRTSGFRARLAATRDLAPVEGFRALLNAWFQYLPTILGFGVALEAAHLTGADGAAAYRDRMDDWLDGIRIAVQRLAEVGALSPHWDVAAASDWVWAGVHPTTYHHLVTERGWTGAEAATRITGSLERELLVTPSGGRRGERAASERRRAKH